MFVTTEKGTVNERDRQCTAAEKQRSSPANLESKRLTKQTGRKRNANERRHAFFRDLAADPLPPLATPFPINSIFSSKMKRIDQPPAASTLPRRPPSGRNRGGATAHINKMLLLAEF